MTANTASETLTREVQGEQPKIYELQRKIFDELAKYSTSKNAEQIIESRRDKFYSLLSTAVELSKTTGDELYALRIETMAAARTKAYEDELTLLQKRVPKNIAKILNADIFPEMPMAA
ncbi:MAG: hypothetical protein ACD_2C00088G0024 [uncultured bacterium (gcode 4)]|uniref:Uncharacterized protein n=1 Tax=uncultured bacterium (gcode 4) TaxID=1234023 RepID=K2GHD6_9BACT|nr:MAG: hypothetical protein ACD_2C00088G0024 [uncultured bacterium (gcode 4)]